MMNKISEAGRNIFGGSQAERAGRFFTALGAAFLIAAVGFGLRSSFAESRRQADKQEHRVHRLKMDARRLPKARREEKVRLKKLTAFLKADPAGTSQQARKAAKDLESVRRFIKKADASVKVLPREHAKEIVLGKKWARLQRAEQFHGALLWIAVLWALGALILFVRAAPPSLRFFLIYCLSLAFLFLVILPAGQLDDGWKSTFLRSLFVAVSLILSFLGACRMKRIYSGELKAEDGHPEPMSAIRRALRAGAPCLYAALMGGGAFVATMLMDNPKDGTLVVWTVLLGAVLVPLGIFLPKRAEACAKDCGDSDESSVSNPQGERAGRFFTALGAALLLASAGFWMGPSYMKSKKRMRAQDHKVKSLMVKAVRLRQYEAVRKNVIKKIEVLRKTDPKARSKAARKVRKELMSADGNLYEAKKAVAGIPGAKKELSKLRRRSSSFWWAELILSVMLLGLVLWAVSGLALFLMGLPPALRDPVSYGFLLVLLVLGGIPLGKPAGWWGSPWFWPPILAALIGLVLVIRLRIKKLESMDAIKRGLWAAAPCLAVLAGGAVFIAGILVDTPKSGTVAAWFVLLGVPWVSLGILLPRRAEKWTGEGRRNLEDSAELKSLLASGVVALVYGLLIFLFAGSILLFLPFVLSATSLIIPHIPVLHPGSRSLWAVFGLTTLLTLGSIRLAGWRQIVLRMTGYAFSKNKSRTLGVPDFVSVPREPKAALAYLFLLVGPALLSLFAVWASHRVWHGRLESLRAELAASGLSTTYADGFRDPLPPGNAFPKLSELIAGHMEKSKFGSVEHPGLEVGRWNAKTLAKEQTYLAANWKQAGGKFLRELKKYSYMQAGTKRQAIENPMAMPRNRAADWIGISKELGLAAGARAAGGDPASAWRYVGAQIRLAELISDNQGVVFQMIAVAIEKIAAQSALNVMYNHRGTRMPPAVARSAGKLAFTMRVRAGMLNEVAISIAYDRWLEKSSRSEIKDAFGSSGEWGTWMDSRLGILDAAGIMRIRSYGLREKEDRRTDWSMRRKIDEARIAKVESLPDWPFMNVKYRIMPGVSDLLRKEVEGHAWMRMALLGSALNGYRGAHGRYPDKLGKLVPRFATPALLGDPFSMKQWRYGSQPDGKGFDLASRGPFGKGMDFNEKKFLLRQR